MNKITFYTGNSLTILLPGGNNENTKIILNKKDSLLNISCDPKLELKEANGNKYSTVTKGEVTLTGVHAASKMTKTFVDGVLIIKFGELIESDKFTEV